MMYISICIISYFSLLFFSFLSFVFGLMFLVSEYVILIEWYSECFATNNLLYKNTSSPNHYTTIYMMV